MEDKYWKPKPGESCTIRFLPQQEPAHTYSGTSWSCCTDLPPAKRRHGYQVLDKRDNKVKMLYVPESVHRQLQAVPHHKRAPLLRRLLEQLWSFLKGK